MEELLAKLKAMLEESRTEVDEIEEDFPTEEYDPSSWSGGNFDDAYELGIEHGEATGEFQTIQRVIAIVEAQK